MKNIIEYFDEEALTHDSNFITEMGMTEFYDEIEYQINQCNVSENILVIGCGTGLEIERIKFPCNVTAIDLSPEMIKQLMKKQYAFGVNVQPVCASILDYELENEKYDIALSCYTLHHFNERQKLNILTKVYTSLKKKGTFINGDSTASNRIEELKGIKAAETIYKEENVKFGSMHIDVPFTKEREVSILKSAGFLSVSIEREWSKTTLYKCIK